MENKTITPSGTPLMKKAGKYMLMLALGLTLTAGAFAQPSGGDDGDPDAPVPFDGGISLLAAAGISYGIKKNHDNKKQKNTTKEN